MSPFDDKTPMPFGKHEGTPLGEVPADYLLWLMGQLDGSPRDAKREALFQYLLENEDALTSEAQDQKRWNN